MSNGITVEEAKSHRAVERYVGEDDLKFLVVRSYGNATLINNLARSSHVRLGNIAIHDADERPNLRVHVTPIGSE